MVRERYDALADMEDAVVGVEQGGWQWLRSVPCWAVSAVLHLVLLLVFMNVIFTSGQGRTDDAAGGVVSIVIAPKPPPPPPPIFDRPERGLETRPEIPGPELTEKSVERKKDVDEVTADIPKGTSLESNTDVTLDFSMLVAQPGTNNATGTGAGVAGSFGLPWETGSPRGGRLGGPPGSEDAVQAALQWLRRHQSPDGSWKSGGFTSMCSQACRNVNESRHGDGSGFDGHDVGVTGLAILAFTGNGHTHRDSDHAEYVECLQRAVAYMKKAQVRSEDPATAGRYGPGTGEQWIYDHAIATMAMGELLIMSGDVIGLRRSVTDAVKLCLRAQNDGFGWRYGIKPGDNDTSVTGWMVLALKTARSAGLDIPREEFDRAFRGAIRWFDRATASNGKTGYMVPGDEGSRLANIYPDPYPYSKDLSCMTAVGVLCRLFAGESRKSRTILQGVDILMRETPRWLEQKGRSPSTINLYHWYYGSYALFQFGGAPWKKWNEDMIKALLHSQRQGIICEDGSWDPIDEWGAAGGRVYSTALGAMTLEVYYRFRRSQQGEGFLNLKA